MKYLIVVVGFLLYSCGCFDIETVENDRESAKINVYKYFTIFNHTDKTYINNELISLEPVRWGGTFRFTYRSSNIVGNNQQRFIYHKINTINPKEMINEGDLWNEKALKLESGSGCSYEDYADEDLFLLSLDGEKRKIFFGAYAGAYGDTKIYYGEVTSDCKRPVIKYDVHPVWQEKELTIHIYNDKITFSDPKIKEVKKLKLTINGKKTEEVDPNTLDLVDCSKE